MAAPDPLHTAERRRAVTQLLNEAARLLYAQRHGEAEELLRRAYKLAPNDPDVAMNLGGALIMTGKWSQAVALLESAVARHPSNARLWLNLAAAYLGRLELSSPRYQEQAIAAYQRAIAIDPATPNAHYNVGLIYAERRDWSAAELWFQQSLVANPSDDDALIWLQRVPRRPGTTGAVSSSQSAC